MITRKLTILLVVVVLSMTTACGGEANAPQATPTTLPTETTAPPTPTSLPSTETPTPLPPTDTLPPPTMVPTIAAFTLPPKPTATTPAIVPTGGVKFHGVFEGGTFNFRTNDKGTMVTLKDIVLRKAVCNGGGKVSNQLTFEDIKFFPVENGSFTISFDRATLAGQFYTPTSASGSIWVNIKADQVACKIGPLFWTAVVE